MKGVMEKSLTEIVEQFVVRKWNEFIKGFDNARPHIKANPLVGNGDPVTLLQLAKNIGNGF